MSEDIKLTPREKIVKARITLLRQHPFFGTMAMHLNPIALEEGSPEAKVITTFGVDIYGNLPYNSKAVEKMTIQQIMTILAHEVMHLALEHFTRKGNRNHCLWNLATDLAINSILAEAMSIGDLVYHEKFKGWSAERIYDYLMKNTIKICIQAGICDKNGKMICPTDFHIYPSGKEGECKKDKDKSCRGGISFKRKGQTPIDPKRLVKDAHSFAKSQGTVPAGLERLFKDFLKPQMNWKEILQKFVASNIPHDFTYTRPSKRSYSTGIYFPSIVKDYVDIVIGVDSSGSISDTEYARFLTEIFMITRSFERVRATLLICDADIHRVVEINENFDPHSVKGAGYGGTSSIPVFNWIEKNKANNIRLLIYFTDGWIDVPQKEPPFPHLWIVTKRGKKDFGADKINGIVIQMEEE